MGRKGSAAAELQQSLGREIRAGQLELGLADAPQNSAEFLAGAPQPECTGLIPPCCNFLNAHCKG